MSSLPEPDPLPGEALAYDWAGLDGLETVTLTKSVTLEQYSVAGALKRPLSLREIEASGGVYVRGDVKFNLPEANLSVAPAAGDTLTDAASRVWNIQEVELLVLGTRYRCWCKPG